jgi:hypothetical protein
MSLGNAFIANGKRCISTGDDGPTCRVDPVLHDELVQQKDCRTIRMKGREYWEPACLSNQLITGPRPGPGTIDHLKCIQP